MPAMDYSKIAELYDVYAATNLDVPFFIKGAHGCQNVLELTSGTGRLSIPLLEAGIPLTCLDSSPEMLSILRKKLDEKSLSAPVYEMDVCRLSLPVRYDLILFPFNSFAEITAPEDQHQALKGIRDHLVGEGRFICTLHNPVVRLKGIDGAVHIRGKFPLPDSSDTLVLSSVENYDPSTRLVTGAQYYERYGANGDLLSKFEVALKFALPSRETFESLALSEGFRIQSLYGDYERNPFDPNHSPFMIWSLAGA